MKKRVIVSRILSDQINSAAAELFDVVLATGRDMNFGEALHHIEQFQADGLLFATNIKLDEEAIAQLPPHLKVAATCSVGYDHIDVAAAHARGLVVTNTPDVLTDCTADFAMTLILTSCRRAMEYVDTVKSGSWTRPFGTSEFLGRNLSGKTLGVVGMGRIGRAVAERARAFGMRIVYHDRMEYPPATVGDAVFYPGLEAMLPRCDVLTIHAPAVSSNHHMINQQTIAMLPRGATLVNTARGTLVDEAALADALDSGHLFAAGLDVFENEPSVHPRLIASKRAVLTPHMASATEETRNAMGMLALKNIELVLAGEPPATPIRL